MTRTPSKAALLGVCAAGVVSLAWSALAQAGDAAPVVYRREVFQYPRAGRPDPFRSLLSAEELGYRIEDLQLTGVIYSPNPRLSAAVLTEVVSKKRFRLHVGERVGGGDRGGHLPAPGRRGGERVRRDPARVSAVAAAGAPARGRAAGGAAAAATATATAGASSPGDDGTAEAGGSTRERTMKRLPGLFILLPALVAAAPVRADDTGNVTTLRVEPRAGRTELTIEVSGDVRWSDFTLSDPPRVVVDISGARSALPSERFQGIDRGGVAAVRTSQYQADVVRVVIDLQRTSQYEVARVPEGIRLSFASGTEPFEPWSSGEAAVARRPEPRQNPPAQQRPQQQRRRMTVSFYEADIRDVLASIAEFAGRSIVAGAGVEGIRVTAEINNQPWDVALETILRANGLAYEELPTGIIRVDRIEALAARREAEPLVTQTFRINYLPVQELAQTLTPLKTQRGSITVNPTTNTLIVTDVAGVVNNIAALLPQLDIRTPQVAIQTKIIFVNRSDVEALGVTYDLKDSRGNSLNRLVGVPERDVVTGELTGNITREDLVLLGGNSIAALGNANARVVGPSLETVISLVLGRYTLISFLDALQTAELSDVQAAPLITTLDNQEAEIWVGERTPIRVIDASGGAAGGAGGAAGAPRATAQLVETGIRLRVTPTITADRRVLMQLHAERSSAQPAAGDIGVTFQTQQGDTRLMVRDGETAVIGGLTVTEVTSIRSGIPFLMDIPFVGALFRTTRRQEQKRDLLIMVTPHIVEDQA
ncbi:MAG TPA: AMIN domain-containing protein [Longimicrobiaceae bacterium]|nr:AMIN domain-containing protein [Longimicrobiaceae bacterium]